jgi:hypothetical protein
VLEPQVSPRQPRSLEAIAVENATEGCVRELYGALLATFQAERARDPEVRGLMQRIAHEETRHAALSLKVQRWLARRLDPAARQRVLVEKRRAAAALACELDVPVVSAVALSAGLPTPAEARQLYRSLLPLLSA